MKIEKINDNKIRCSRLSAITYSFILIMYFNHLFILDVYNIGHNSPIINSIHENAERVKKKMS